MSLNEHLMRSEGHETLPFRADCPICRASRLAGPVPGRPANARGTAALMVVAMSAASTTVAPPVSALAQGGPGDVVAPEEVQSGGGELGVSDPEAQPQLPGSDDSADPPPAGDPGLDEGAEVPDPAPEGEGLEPSPIVEPDAPQAVPEEVPPPAPSPPPVAPPAPPPAAPAPPPTAPPVTAPAPAPPQAPPAEAVPAPVPAPTTPAEPAPAPPDSSQGEAKDQPARHQKPQSPPPAEPLPAPPPAEPPPAPPQPVESAPVAMAEPASSPPAGPVGDVYVVRPGDTLWSIAERRLGPGAGPAAIARFVDRLWTMNAAALATGSPDLIVPGQRLRIPETG